MLEAHCKDPINCVSFREIQTFIFETIFGLSMYSIGVLFSVILRALASFDNVDSNWEAFMFTFIIEYIGMTYPLKEND